MRSLSPTCTCFHNELVTTSVASLGFVFSAAVASFDVVVVVVVRDGDVDGLGLVTGSFFLKKEKRLPCFRVLVLVLLVGPLAGGVATLAPVTTLRLVPPDMEWNDNDNEEDE